MKKFITYNLKLIIFLLGFYIMYSARIASIYAQTVDPANWQNNAIGLKTSTNGSNQTAGLTTTVKVGSSAAGGIPFMMLQGGVYDSWGRSSTTTGIDLGQIKNPGATSASLTAEIADWAHNQMVFTTNLNNQINVWVSRLTPAILVQNSTNSLALFSGNLSGATIQPSQWAPYAPQVTNRTSASSFPKYIAYHSGGSVRVQQIPASGATALILPALDNNWILVWYGSNSHFTDLKLPLGYALGGDWGVGLYTLDQGYLADAPILLKFANNPVSLIQGIDGGIDLSFSGNSGYVSIMPLFGREHLKASDTEVWGASGTLPANVLTKINFWNTNNRLCSYPVTVSENYAYDANSDTSTIAETIAYLNVCSGGSTTGGLAILPPAVSLAKDALGSSFNVSGVLIDAQYPTEFGPIIGIDNANTYSYSVAGLKKYTDSKRIIVNQGVEPTDLVSELATQADKTTQAGHFIPWIFNDVFPQSIHSTDVYFANPADIILSLAEVIPVLPEPQKGDLINYLRVERANFPPETVYNLSLTSGKVRDFFSVPPNLSIYGTPVSTWITRNEPWFFLTKVPLYSFFALSRYYDITTDAVSSSLINSAKTVLDSEMAERDWASMSYFRGFKQSHAAVNDANRTLAGIIGYIKLMKAFGDATEGLGRSLLAKMAIERIAMAKYPRYLYAANLVSLPSNPDWMGRITANQWWQGFITNYNWISGNDDTQQVVQQDQFGTSLYEHIGYYPPGQATCCDPVYYFRSTKPKLIGYLDLVPETFRLMTDFVKSDMQILFDKYTTIFPHWYTAYMESVLGNENDNSHPVDSYQLFLANVFIKGDSGKNLRRYRSISWLDSGDFFYMHKLAETIKAYQGWGWEDEVTGPALTGDLNNDTQVNVLDVQACVNHILGIQNLGSRGDVNSDGDVNVLDVQSIVNIILGV